MKKTLTILLLLTMVGSAIAQKNKETNCPVTGSWKFSNQSSLNDFQKVFENKQQRDYKTEYFTFETNRTFKHEFVDENGNLVRTLKGKWKAISNKIKIDYSDVDYSLTLDYFFIDKDLVLGQNFNHVIFTKNNADYNLTMK